MTTEAKQAELEKLISRREDMAEAKGFAAGRAAAFSQAIRVACIDGPLTVSELERIEEFGEKYGTLANAEAKKGGG